MVPKIDKKVILVAVFVPMLLLVNLVPQCLTAEEFEPKWESLKKHQTPEWFRDAKFGCWACWCPGVVVTDKVDFKAEWFGRQMYTPKHAAFEYMRKHYGDQKEFGYKDLIPLLKGEKFNAGEWAELFQRAGAKFAGPLAIFHDNYPLWDSAVTRYDGKDVGPKRDIVAEWEKAVKKRGMKFAATFHHGFAWGFYEPAYQYDAADPQYADLYCQPHEPKAPPTTHYQERWLAMVNEVVNQYEPDLIYFDFGLERVITPEYQRRMFSDYYNWAVKHGRQVGVTHKHRNIHRHTGILDFERGREDRLTPYPWQTDTSVSTWFYHNAAEYRSVNEFVDMLADIVSKNGCLFLNVPMRADGSIPAQAWPIMKGIGDWLKVNGEAIYGTRTWEIFGEGPTQNTGGKFSERKDKPYTAKDIRFTRSKDGKTLYAIALGWPSKSLTLTAVKVLKAGPNARVTLLGYDKALKFTVNDKKQLVIGMPDLDATQRPCQQAYSFKLTGFELDVHGGEIAAGPFKPTVESLR